jgi:hypothetical protein
MCYTPYHHPWRMETRHLNIRGKIMIPFDTLNVQNHEVSELSKVLTVLIQDREICDTTITCDLFLRYTDKVKTHLDMVDKTLFSDLLSHSDSKINATANRFLNGSREIKRIFNSYTHKWCAKGLHIYNHDQFIAETQEIFRLIQGRTLAETEELYPLARQVENEKLALSA